MMCATIKPKYVAVVVALFSHCGNEETTSLRWCSYKKVNYSGAWMTESLHGDKLPWKLSQSTGYIL